MTDFRDVQTKHRFEQGFADDGGELRAVFADYAIQGSTRVILHVEADPALRGSGAAGRFMQALAEHARAENLKLAPRCGYAVAWLKRHPEFDDLAA
ncbi:MAG: GNAT family N-acetyltransferase [Brevundimonas sp.]|uniref:GNAT family N-acetyltransferase n=1 Tax=Brevundimonas sp. TaxID=1871086 RepID=UPI00271F2606|nr:GNAT family N-acetyltransferase [Brevundimonas sp.]MDO9588670.1 GNAT family N-acetyltransferase [Brevundimonas sp.]MDP3371185.1 GNAT family N-acetyltransferase [Brevundimonas sp.]MDP3658384.1 GNAT family N-acetyltransferase [Brevundimonas sp.]MDZ4109624.1 GNAT family N-acetyltransferase [Brevundimonas sp.]